MVARRGAGRVTSRTSSQRLACGASCARDSCRPSARRIRPSPPGFLPGRLRNPRLLFLRPKRSHRGPGSPELSIWLDEGSPASVLPVLPAHESFAATRSYATGGRTGIGSGRSAGHPTWSWFETSSARRKSDLMGHGTTCGPDLNVSHEKATGRASLDMDGQGFLSCPAGFNGFSSRELAAFWHPPSRSRARFSPLDLT